MDDRQVAAFDDRYGHGAHDRLLTRLKHPCATFAEIADEFGVTRERVRQWHQLWLPEAPRGLERRRQCRHFKRRRVLLEEPIFNGFYRHLRPALSPGRLTLVPTRDGFRRRTARVDGRLVLIKAARELSRRHRPDVATYALAGYRGRADLLYFDLGPGDFLLMPASALPRAGTLFVDLPSSKYQRFRNSLIALGSEGAVQPAAGIADDPHGRGPHNHGAKERHA